MSSVKKNFAYSSILTISGYLFPLITFPYVTRVLGAEGIGKYNFAISVIQYFSTFAMLGIGTVGIREIATVKNDSEKRSHVFSSLLILNLISTLFAAFVLIVLIQLIPSFVEHEKLLYIGVGQLFATTLVVEWFFKGIEDFKYVTIRSIIVRVFYVASVLLFVKDPEDYVIYFFLTTLTVVVNAVINLIYARKFIHFSFRNLKIKEYIGQFVILGIYQILTAMYVSFNVIFLGSKCGDVEVGYYSAATKLCGLIMALFTAFTGVMLPRMCSLLAEGKKEVFLNMTNKSIDVLLMFSLPIIVISEVYAPQIIRIIAGEGYENAILPFRIVMPLMFVIGYEQIIIIQMLSPLHKDKAVFINSCLGACVALLLNFLIVPKMGSVGSAIVWCCCELTVLVSAQFFLERYIGYRFPGRRVFKSSILIIPSLLICFLLNFLIPNTYIAMIIGAILVVLFYVVIELFVIKNEVASFFYSEIKKQVCKRKFQ